MARPQQANSGDDWRLGIDEPIEHPTPRLAGVPPQKPDSIEPARHLSHERLERPLQVVTVEHLGWFAIAAWTLLTRIPWLGARPLDEGEARAALFEFDLATNATHHAAAHPAWGGWIHLVQAGMFAVLGGSDADARIVAVIAGLALIALAFELRPYVGRAGALALGAMLALSPTITWFSRAGDNVMPAMALGMATIVLFFRLTEGPDTTRAVALGIAAGLMAAADPIGLVTLAIFIAALALIGPTVLPGGEVWLRARVWMDRYMIFASNAIVAAIVTWGISEAILWRQLTPGLIADGVASMWSASPDALSPAEAYLPPLVLNEFLIAVTAVIGAILIIAWRIRSRFAVWCLWWCALIIGFCVALRVNAPEFIAAIIVPAAMLGAFAVDYLHRSEVWPHARWPLAALAALTLYLQINANFIHYAPDASEATWSRHGNLLWGRGATTLQTRAYAQEIEHELSPTDATVAFEGGEAPALEWYLRRLRPAEDKRAAAVRIDLNAAADSPDPEDGTRYIFNYEQSWIPDMTALDPAAAVRFIFTGRSWGAVKSRGVAITARPAGMIEPTPILPPPGVP